MTYMYLSTAISSTTVSVQSFVMSCWRYNVYIYVLHGTLAVLSMCLGTIYVHVSDNICMYMYICPVAFTMRLSGGEGRTRGSPCSEGTRQVPRLPRLLALLLCPLSLSPACQNCASEQLDTTLLLVHGLNKHHNIIIMYFRAYNTFILKKLLYWHTDRT